MKIVDNIICGIKEEICGALGYAENYLSHKKTNANIAKIYAEMAQQELSHAESLMQIGQEKINGLAWMPEEDKESWAKCNAKAAEKMAMARLMLSK